MQFWTVGRVAQLQYNVLNEVDRFGLLHNSVPTCRSSQMACAMDKNAARYLHNAGFEDKNIENLRNNDINGFAKPLNENLE